MEKNGNISYIMKGFFQQQGFVVRGFFAIMMSNIAGQGKIGNKTFNEYFN
jgi:hypothetical protein